jgi:hypothetical protein
LTIIPDPPHFQILGQKGPVTVANFAGTDKPVAILDDDVLELLVVQCRNAKTEAQKTGVNVNAALELCTTLGGVLSSYTHIRNEYYDRIEIERERTEAEHDLQEAISALQQPRSPQ